MTIKGHTEEQIIAALRQADGRRAETGEFCRKLGVSHATTRDKYRFNP